MTILEQIITIAICALGTMATRFLPFLIFRDKRPTPKYVQCLGKALPAAIFGMLVVYCLKDVSVTAYSFGIPELIGVLHLAEAETGCNMQILGRTGRCHGMIFA